MRYSSLTMRWPRDCESCGRHLAEGVPAYGGKNSSDKWEFLCPECHKEEKLNGDATPAVLVEHIKPRAKGTGDMEAALSFISGIAGGLSSISDKVFGATAGTFEQMIKDASEGEWSEKSDTVTFVPGSRRCQSCGNDIDPDTCHCGAPRDGHNDYNLGHSFVPNGCTCGYAACGRTDQEPQEKKGPEPFSKDWIKENAVWGRI